MARFNAEDVGKPVDYSFRDFKSLKKVDLETVRETRIGEMPKRSQIRPNKYLTSAVLVNNNKLKNINNLEEFIDNLIENPIKLAWLDFSYNYIRKIDPVILKYKQLSIVYFHGNKIERFEDIALLRPLSKLRSATFHGNPVAKQKNYRTNVIALLPQIWNLDFTPITKKEKNRPGPAEANLILKNMYDSTNSLRDDQQQKKSRKSKCALCCPGKQVFHELIN